MLGAREPWAKICEVSRAGDVYLVGFTDGFDSVALKVAFALARKSGAIDCRYALPVGLRERQKGSGWITAPGLFEVEAILTLRVSGENRHVLIATDPEDGYRSSLAPIVMSPPIAGLVHQFEHAPIRVACDYRTAGQADTQIVTDRFDDDYVACGHVWLEFGTEYIDQYYPSSFCTWTPKEPR